MQELNEIKKLREIVRTYKFSIRTNSDLLKKLEEIDPSAVLWLTESIVP